MRSIRFVDVGEGITEGHLLKWMVTDGNFVNEDTPVAKVETDKAVVDVPAPISANIKIMLPAGTVLKVGDTLAYLGTPDELKGAGSQQSQAHAQKTTASQAPQQMKTSADVTHGVIATPSVRKMARDLGIDITKVRGSGPGGRILESDLKPGQTAPAAQNVAQPSMQQTAPPKFSGSLEAQHAGEIERRPMSMTRKTIAKNMEASWTIPRATSMELVNATTLFNLVQREKPKVLEQKGVKLTFLPFIIKALIEALKEMPTFNASYDKEKQEIIVKKYYNIGLAAEAPDGLKVVVIKNADKKSILDIAAEIIALSQKLKDKTISIDEMRDSTFTITNIGSLGGGFEAVPMINYPEVAILGVLMIRDMPIVVEGQVAVGKVMPISLVFDHRVNDGAEAVHFTNILKNYLEDPDFLEMLG